MKETKFKQTEVGMIPSDWDVCEIGSVCSIFGRIGFRGYTVLDLVDEGCGAITLSPSNIKNNRMDYSKYTEISWKKYEESPEIKIFNGDILLVKTGSTFGKSALVENLPHEATINPQFVVLKKIQISNAYLNYVIADTVVQKQIQETIVGGAIPTLSQKQIAGFNIPLPSSTEQQRIANALSDVDTLINNLEKLIAKKKNIKQGAMQQLLTGKKRLPGFAPAKPTYKQTELGMIPTDWEFEFFGKLVSIYRGGSPRPIEAYITTNPSGINWIKIGDVDGAGNTFVGTLGRYKVYIDPYINDADDSFAMVGYKGATELEAGYFYCPYIPLEMYEAVDAARMQPSIAFKSRYGTISNPYTGAGAGANGFFRKSVITGF